MDNPMDVTKTKEYYSDYWRKDACTCVYCQNLADEIKAAYPELTEFLASFGVNIERPFERITRSNETFTKKEKIL